MPLNQAINQVTYTCGAPWNLDPGIPSIELGWFSISVEGHKAPEGNDLPWHQRVRPTAWSQGRRLGPCPYKRAASAFMILFTVNLTDPVAEKGSLTP